LLAKLSGMLPAETYQLLEQFLFLGRGPEEEPLQPANSGLLGFVVERSIDPQGGENPRLHGRPASTK
jgi:hypothetical protein